MHFPRICCAGYPLPESDSWLSCTIGTERAQNLLCWFWCTAGTEFVQNLLCRLSATTSDSLFLCIAFTEHALMYCARYLSASSDSLCTAGPGFVQNLLCRLSTSCVWQIVLVHYRYRTFAEFMCLRSSGASRSGQLKYSGDSVVALLQQILLSRWNFKSTWFSSVFQDLP